MDERLSILNVGGHPKDAIMYAGGTTAKHVALGDQVCTVIPGGSRSLGRPDGLRSVSPAKAGVQAAEHGQFSGAR